MAQEKRDLRAGPDCAPARSAYVERRIIARTDDHIVQIVLSKRNGRTSTRGVATQRSERRRSAGIAEFGRLEIDEAAREARMDGVDVRLKPREFALLLELAGNVGIALSRERLLERVRGSDFQGDERTVDVHVRRLRAKNEEEARLPPMVHTIHGFGYKFARA